MKTAHPSSPSSSTSYRRGFAAIGAVGAVVVTLSGCARWNADTPTTPNAEERRLSLTLADGDSPVSTSMIAISGLGSTVAAFRDGLATSEAEDVVSFAEASGSALWSAAVAKAQGGDADAPDAVDEDRGLYWARLAMRSELKSWVDGDDDREAQLEAAIEKLETSSRGYGDTSFAADGARHVMLSGFDPFGDWEATPYLGNPSGSIALHLDGRTIDTPDGPVAFQAVMLPVSWEAFDAGAVEEAYAPVLADGEAGADLVVTVSQGGFEDFQIEQWAGAWRGGSPDNLGAGASEGFREEVPKADGFAQPKKNPQFIETTLPHEDMIAAATPSFDVILNQTTCVATSAERADADVSCDDHRPAAGAFAVSGGGGSFLSNESMYRVNRLRLALGRDDVEGGHLHTPLPDYSDVDATGSGPTFAAHRSALVDEAQTLLLAAAVAAQ